MSLQDYFVNIFIEKLKRPFVNPVSFRMMSSDFQYIPKIPFRGYWRHVIRGANTSKITANVWENWRIQLSHN